jgi:hypothetical protein
MYESELNYPIINPFELFYNTYVIFLILSLHVSIPSLFIFFLIKCKKYIDKKIRLAGKPASQKYRCTEQACGNKLPTSTRNTA